MEKRKIIALLAFAMLAAASTVNATTVVIAPGGTYFGEKTGQASVQMGKLSTNVSIVCNYDTTTYAATSKHLNGDKQYGISAMDTRLMVMDKAKGVSQPDQPTNSDSTAFSATTWTSL